MANFTVTGYLSPTKTFTVDGGSSAVANTDTLTIDGVKQTIQEWIRCGVVRYVSTSGNINTYLLQANPEIVGQMAGASAPAATYALVIVQQPGLTLDIKLTDGVTTTPLAVTATYNWGDSSNTTTSNGLASHTYAANGTYTVTATVNGVQVASLVTSI